MTGYMLDTNAFNRWTDGPLPLDALKRHRVYATSVQQQELERTRDPGRRAALLATFKNVAPIIEGTHSFVLDESRLDLDKLGDGVLLERIRALVIEYDKDQGKTQHDPMNVTRDALIAETAIGSGLTLITDDRSLYEAVQKIGGDVITVDDFMNLPAG